MNNMKILILIFSFGFSAIGLATILTYQSNNDRFDTALFLGWTGFTFGGISLVYSIIETFSERDKIDKMSKSIEDLIEMSRTFNESIDTSIEYQRTQNERLDNIEKELKIYQKKLTSTNLLAIFLNRKKETDKDYEKDPE
jgi:Na+/phosphate symporter